MRVLVTGATGLIGGAVTRRLKAAGHEVVGLARSEASAGKLAREGFTDEEIARHLNVTTRTFRNWKDKARQWMTREGRA